MPRSLHSFFNCFSVIVEKSTTSLPCAPSGAFQVNSPTLLRSDKRVLHARTHSLLRFELPVPSAKCELARLAYVVEVRLFVTYISYFLFLFVRGLNARPLFNLLLSIRLRGFDLDLVPCCFSQSMRCAILPCAAFIVLEVPTTFRVCIFII